MRMELQALAKQLDAAEERINLAKQATGLGIWDWDVEAGILTWDENMFRLFPCAQQTNDYEMFISQVYKDDVAEVNRKIQAALEGADYDYAYRVYMPDGSLQAIRGKGKVVEWSNGKASRVIGVCLKAE